MIRVANIIEDGRLAGPQLRILSVAAELNKRGIKTIVIFPNVDSKEFAHRLDKSRIDYITVSLTRLARGLRPVLRYFIYFPFEIFILWRLFRRLGIDYVHCSGGFWQVKGLIAAKIAGIPAIWHMNDTIFPIKWRFLFLFISRHFANKLIFAGRRVYEHYLGLKTCPVEFIEIQAPVNTDIFNPQETKPDSVISSINGIKIVTVANINPLKGIEYFIKMANILNQKFNELHFFIIGPIYDSQNNYYRKLIELIQQFKLKNLSFYGSAQNIPSILKAADIYVCSSISEASPTSVWEAMSMGKAIVSADVGDVKHFVINGISGFIVPPKDVDELVAKTSKLIENLELREQYGTTARSIALKNLHLSVCVDGHIKAYSKN